MPKYIFAYHGGTRPENPADAEKAMAAWGTWFENMGNAVVDGGAPVGPSQTVHAGGVDDNGGANPLSGYTMVETPDIAAALALAKSCPIVNDGGSVEVAEVLPM